MILKKVTKIKKKKIKINVDFPFIHIVLNKFLLINRFNQNNIFFLLKKKAKVRKKIFYNRKFLCNFQ
jgi:hypothetical protein